MIVELLGTFFGGTVVPADPPKTMGQVFQSYVLVTIVIGIPAGLFASGAFAVLMKVQNKLNAKRRAKIREEIRNAAQRRPAH